MNVPLRCRCGSVEGQLAAPRRAGRAMCYCRDCQAFARFLGEPERILSAEGGTEIVATSPRHVRFTRGLELLRCMSLSEAGLLRWYTLCCRTPIGNTPRDPKLSYVGLVHACVAGSAGERDAAFGPLRVAINTGSARAKVRATPMASVRAILKIVRNVAGSRLGGGYKRNPFFQPGSSRPIVEPQVLAPAQRAALRADD
jgi:hypothetical protein